MKIDLIKIFFVNALFFISLLFSLKFGNDYTSMILLSVFYGPFFMPVYLFYIIFKVIDYKSVLPVFYFVSIPILFLYFSWLLLNFIRKNKVNIKIFIKIVIIYLICSFLGIIVTLVQLFTTRNDYMNVDIKDISIPAFWALFLLLIIGKIFFNKLKNKEVL